jgi:N-methylhydantoinase A
LEIPRVLVPAAPGLFCATGLLAAGLQYDLVRTCLRRIDTLGAADFQAAFAEMAEEAHRMLPGAGLERSADLRYVGQSYELGIPVPGGAVEADLPSGLQAGFEAEHERTYGHRAETDPVEVVTFRLRATLPAPDLPLPQAAPSGDGDRIRPAYFGASCAWIDTPVLQRGDLPSEPTKGPLIVEDYDATTLVPPDSRGFLDSWGNIVIEVG